MNKTNFILFWVTVAILIFVVRPLMGDRKADDRVAFWVDKVEDGIYEDMSLKDLVSWGNDNFINFTTSGYGQMTAELEKVSGIGFAPFYCSDWKIVVEVSFDPFDRVEKKKVRKVSSCDTY